MSSDPTQELLRTFLKILEEKDRETILAKRRLTGVLGLDLPEDPYIYLKACDFVVEEGPPQHALLTPYQRDKIDYLVLHGGSAADVFLLVNGMLQDILKVVGDARHALGQILTQGHVTHVFEASKKEQPTMGYDTVPAGMGACNYPGPHNIPMCTVLNSTDCSNVPGSTGWNEGQGCAYRGPMSAGPSSSAERTDEPVGQVQKGKH